MGSTSQNGPQKYQKALGFQLKLMAFYDFEKCQESIGPRAFWSIQKSISEYLIKPVDFWWIPSQNRKKAPEMIKKALCL